MIKNDFGCGFVDKAGRVFILKKDAASGAEKLFQSEEHNLPKQIIL